MYNLILFNIIFLNTAGACDNGKMEVHNYELSVSIISRLD